MTTANDNIAGATGLSEWDALYNAVLKTVKEYGAGMEIGLVRAVLNEVGQEIIMRTNRENLEIVCEKLKERKPRGCE